MKSQLVECLSVLMQVAAPNLGTVLAVSAGYLHTCVLTTEGQVLCFGRDAEGQCDVPADLGRVLAVSAGYHHTCAIQASGQLVCFGMNLGCLLAVV